MEHVIEIIKNNSKKPKIAHIGYIYHFQKECSNFIRWRCSKFISLKCQNVLKTSLDIEKPIFISIDNDHVHTSNKNAVVVLKLQNKMNEKAQISYTTPSQIFVESVSNVPHNILVELPKEEHVKWTIQNHRGYNDPSKPTCRKELIIEGRGFFPPESFVRGFFFRGFLFRLPFNGYMSHLNTTRRSIVWLIGKHNVN
ncbi:hypothetical protein AGLY_002474 [Aphis glycines]|uniref:FLYWCH-type domain-containing protein n=1 Tax=Aphis glycines TaxID=307491 RepID=A0A6G0U0U9_APHGL|nr:hypothetical protein AGLY_002474 [Aphis glycines]